MEPGSTTLGSTDPHINSDAIVASERSECGHGLSDGSVKFLKPVGELLIGESHFVIPKYQRGYRWKEAHVQRLLDDLGEFIDQEGNEEGRTAAPFYCLQPLVVHQAEDGKWNVVDGQQRLTTLYLILKYLIGTGAHQKLFTLSYATRPNSEQYLKNIDRDRKDENIDFHHIYRAWQTIQAWFEKKTGSDRTRFFEILQNADPDPSGRNVRFIWYELPEGDEPEEAFTRINVGKIPLADEELIRALFLRHPAGGLLADSAFQHRLAIDWDRIETRLRDPACWAFLSKDPLPETGCIRLVLKLCASEGIAKADEHGLFLDFEEALKGADAEGLQAKWREIVACFETLEEWWRDHEFFHLIGFLNAVGESKIRHLREEAKKHTKAGFMRYLRERIREQLIGANDMATFLGELDYHQHGPKIRETLLLFNLAGLLRCQQSNLRFPFHRYHENAWDIEHVGSQAGDNLDRLKDQLEWLEMCKPILQEHGDQQILLEELNRFINRTESAADFQLLRGKVLEALGEDGPNGGSAHGIGNLTLLDASTNRAYKNAPFVVKRATILRNDKEGTFFLPRTRDLFLKVFSKKPRDLRKWTEVTPENPEGDDVDYEAAIRESLEWFFETPGVEKQ